MLRLPRSCDRPILALGGHLKATFAFGRDDRALLGHHIGDLDDHRAYGSYVEAIAHYERVFQLTPAALVHDLHPDYGSTRYAQTRGVPRIAVQHHHAHVASCMAEHGLAGPVIGVAFDGSGYGLDGALWGGELLLGDLRAFERVAHLRYVPLPGGERAIREPWRMALSHLLDAGAGALAASLLDVPATERALVERMIEQRINAPLTSSVGRLFDAIAAIAGLGLRTTFEGQAAMQLEWLAATAPAERAYEFTIVEGIIDSGPVVRAAAADRLAGVAAARIARRFHEAIIDLVVAMCRRIREASAVAEVALSGGVFQNAIVTAGVCDRLGACGFRVYQHREVPPNDGGLALGQLAIAAARGVD
jgi:hydrogenase maturation protein HypF